MDNEQAAKAQRAVLRWRILKTIEIGRPYKVAEDIIYQTVAGPDMPITGHDLRRQLDYLKIRGLLLVTGQGTPQWAAELTRYGVDLVEYEVECEAGIARPVKYW